jgi:hypothetical protein
MISPEICFISATVVKRRLFLRIQDEFSCCLGCDPFHLVFTEDWAVELNDAVATFGTPLILAFTMTNFLTNECKEYSYDVHDSDKIHSSVEVAYFSDEILCLKNKNSIFFWMNGFRKMPQEIF